MMNRCSLHIINFRRMHLSVFRRRLAKNGFADPKSFREFRGNGPLVIEMVGGLLRFAGYFLLSNCLIKSLNWLSFFLFTANMFSPSS